MIIIFIKVVIINKPIILCLESSKSSVKYYEIISLLFQSQLYFILEISFFNVKLHINLNK